MAFPFDLGADTVPRLGLIVLQSDERIERDFAKLLPDHLALVSRVPSAPSVSSDSLQAMAGHLSGAAALLPDAQPFDVVGYGCTSGSAQIGPDRIADLVRAGAHARAVTEPVSALVAACRALSLSRLAMVSPYVAPVSARLREVLQGHGIATPVFGSFDEASEARVARITPASILAAARGLADQGGVDGLFLSCTNLNTLDVIADIEAETGLAVLSSNQVLAWHMARLSGCDAAIPGRLAACVRIS